MKIMIAAGGTGGHVNPALAVAGELKKQMPDCEIRFVGTADRIESKVVPEAGFPLDTIKISGFKRSFSGAAIKSNLKTVSQLFKSSSAVKKILRDFSPDVVVGFGGYVSGPVVRMAAKMGIPTAIHEQNAYPGVTNKALSSRVDAVMLTVAEAAKELRCKNEPIITGLPIRGELLLADPVISRAELKFDDKPIVLSMGGSLGAQAINEAMTEVIANKWRSGRCNFLHATGQYGLWMFDKLKERGVDLNSKNVQVREYINDMARCLSAADLVICRAGASSLSEFEALGKPSILIPSPNVTENHQYHNAMALVDHGAAVIIEEKDLTSERLQQEIERLITDHCAREKLGENAKKLACLDATERICKVITNLVAGKNAG